MLNKANKVTLI